MNELLQQFRVQLAGYGPNLLAGLAVLVVGGFVAYLAALLVRKTLGKVSIDNRIAQWVAGPDRQKPVPIELWAGKAVFYFLMLFVVIAFLETVKLPMVTEPLNSLVQPLVAYLPRLLGAGLLGAVAWVLATVLKKLISGALRTTKLDEKLGGTVGAQGKPLGLSSTFADVVYWLVFLLFVPAILQALDMQALLVPVTSLFNKVFAFLPNLISAAAIGAIGWLIARILQRVVQGLLVAAGADRLSEKWGMGASLGKQKLSGVLGLVVYFVVLVPVLISALGALQMDAITKPASDMLSKILAALPNIFGAAVIVLLALVIGKIIAGLTANLLAGLGLNNLPVKLGLTSVAPQGKQAPSAWAGIVVFSLIILLASVNAAEMLGFALLGTLIKDFITFAGHILAGVAMLGLGLFLAQVVAKAVGASNTPNARRLALVVRVVILALVGAMALRQTGLANEIVNIAFGLTLGAAAVAFALAFGLGGRDVAARSLETWRAAEEKPQARHESFPA